MAALTRIFGVHNLALAEDVVQDAFVRAMEVWSARGVPDSPGAWLMTTARNRALELTSRGLALLEESAAGDRITTYQVEAAIAAAHATAPSLAGTDWATIVELYDRLLALSPGPIVALNRAIAIGERDGAERGLAELSAIADRDRLESYPFSFAARAELELRRGDRAAARSQFEAALARARNPTEERFLAQRLAACA